MRQPPRKTLCMSTTFFFFVSVINTVCFCLVVAEYHQTLVKRLTVLHERAWTQELSCSHGNTQAGVRGDRKESLVGSCIVFCQRTGHGVGGLPHGSAVRRAAGRLPEGRGHHVVAWRHLLLHLRPVRYVGLSIFFPFHTDFVCQCYRIILVNKLN